MGVFQIGEEATTSIVREPSIARTYECLGVEHHCMDDDEQPQWAHGPQSAMEMDLGDASSLVPTVKTSSRPSSSSRRASSMGATKVKVSKHSIGSLPPLATTFSSKGGRIGRAKQIS